MSDIKLKQKERRIFGIIMESEITYAQKH